LPCKEKAAGNTLCIAKAFDEAGWKKRRFESMISVRNSYYYSEIEEED